MKCKYVVIFVIFSCFFIQQFVIGQNKIVESRVVIIENLKNKIANNQPLIVHVLVPLCDNEHQGIVPTSPKIGNGMDLKNNLYWATSAGMKRFFNDATDWKFIKSILNPNTSILERVLFSKKYSNGAVVYLIADAYRGDRMQQCLNDYFNSLSGVLQSSISVGLDTFVINGSADMMVFNGHNGLMDESTSYSYSLKHNKPKDAVSISCFSSNYFKHHYEQTNSYPLVHTTGLLYPGAFILKNIIDEWAMLKSDKECRVAAGKAYYFHKPKSGPNGSQNLFNYGW